MAFKKLFIPLIILGLGIVAMTVFSKFGEEPPRIIPPPATKIVDTKVIELKNIPAQIISYGRLSSSQPVVLFSEVSGELQKGSIDFYPAQKFKRGDLLLKIDDRQARLNLNSAKSDLLNALASVLPEIKVDFPVEYEKWQNYFDATTFEKKLAELPEPANQKIKLFLSRFNVYKLFFTAKNLEILLDKHKIYAPFAGSIQSTDLRVGSTTRNGTRLGEILNLESLEVEVPVQTQDLAWLNPATSVTLTSEELTGRWQGHISRIGQSIEDRTQTVPVFIRLDRRSGQGLYSGMFLKANFIGKAVENAVVIPQSVLYEENNVYLIREGRLHYQAVDIARKETDKALINGQLSTGDTLVVSILQGVAPGMRAKSRDLTTVAGGEQ